MAIITFFFFKNQNLIQQEPGVLKRRFDFLGQVKASIK